MRQREGGEGEWEGGGRKRAREERDYSHSSAHLWRSKNSIWCLFSPPTLLPQGLSYSFSHSTWLKLIGLGASRRFYCLISHLTAAMLGLKVCAVTSVPLCGFWALNWNHRICIVKCFYPQSHLNGPDLIFWKLPNSLWHLVPMSFMKLLRRHTAVLHMHCPDEIRPPTPGFRENNPSHHHGSSIITWPLQGGVRGRPHRVEEQTGDEAEENTRCWESAWLWLCKEK